MKDRIFLCVNHHSDLIWRRTKKEYDYVRERQIFYNLDLFEKHPEYRFCFDQANVLKVFFLQHPECKEKLKSLVREGKIEIVGGLLSIPDTNLVSGESLVRNFLLGLQYFEKEFGKKPSVAWLADAFGMSAQLPQILTNFGFQFLCPGHLPGLPEQGYDKGFRWEGLGGSVVIVSRQHACLETTEHSCNIPLVYTVKERMAHSLSRMQGIPGTVFALYMTEEDLIDETVFRLVKLSNKKAEKQIVFSQPSEYFKSLKEERMPTFKDEFNPIFTGCYTSHIEVKKANRQAENSLLGAERISVLANVLRGASYPGTTFNSLWERLCICQFHDGICGCHSDSVYEEMKGELADIKAKAEILTVLGMTTFSGGNGNRREWLVFNPANWKRNEIVYLPGIQKATVVTDNTGESLPFQADVGGIHCMVKAPSFGFVQLKIKGGKLKKPRVIQRCEIKDGYTTETDEYVVSVEDDQLRIKPKFLKRNIFPEEEFGEVLIREDNGDLWTENFLGPVYGKDFQEEKLKNIIEGELFTEIFFNGRVKPQKVSFEPNCLWEGFGQLSWEKSFVFFRMTKRFLMKIKLHWKGNNTKILLRFPLQIEIEKAKAFYGIPYGCLERKPYFEVPVRFQSAFREVSASVLQTSKGDWPTLHWVDYSDKYAGLAIANRGTPGVQLKGGDIFISLLRSPTRKFGGLLPGPSAYENGSREYEFALLPHPAEALAEAVKLGEEFNSPLVTTSIRENASIPYLSRHFLYVSQPGIVLSAFKKAENGNAVVIRLYETLGRSCKAALSLGFPLKKIEEADMAEIPQRKLQGTLLNFRPFEIKTLLCTL